MITAVIIKINSGASLFDCFNFKALRTEKVYVILEFFFKLQSSWVWWSNFLGNL